MKDYEVTKVQKLEESLQDVNKKLKLNLVFSVAGLALACTIFASAPVGSVAYASALGVATGSLGSIVRKLKQKSQIKKEIKKEQGNQRVM